MIFLFRLFLVPLTTCNININTPKCREKIQNTELHLSQTFPVRDTNLYEAFDGIKLRHKPENGAMGRVRVLLGTISAEKTTELFCTWMVITVCVLTATLCTLCYVLRVVLCQAYFTTIKNNKAFNHLLALLVYGHRKRIGPLWCPELLVRRKQVFSIVSVSIWSRYEAKSKG